MPPEPELPEDIPPLPGPQEQSAAWKPKKLPWWRKLLAAVSGATAAAVFAQAVCGVNIGDLVGAEGVTSLAAGQLRMYGAFIAALIVLLIPLTLFVGVYYLQGKKYCFIALLVLLECMIPFFLVFEGRKPQARELVIIVVLCALGVAGRAAFFMLPQFKPVIALSIVAGVAFGGETGFLAGALFWKGLLRRSRASLCVFGALAAIVIYGGIMNPASALMVAGVLNWKTLLTYYVSGFPMDCIHASASVLFLWFAAEPMLEKLDRVKVKYGLVE